MESNPKSKFFWETYKFLFSEPHIYILVVCVFFFPWFVRLTVWQFYVFKEATLVLLIFLYFYFYLLYSSFCLFWVYVALFFSSFSRLKLSIYLRSSFLLWAFKAINPSMHCFSCTNMLNFHFYTVENIFSFSLWFLVWAWVI